MYDISFTPNGRVVRGVCGAASLIERNNPLVFFQFSTVSKDRTMKIWDSDGVEQLMQQLKPRQQEQLELFNKVTVQNFSFLNHPSKVLTIFMCVGRSIFIRPLGNNRSMVQVV